MHAVMRAVTMTACVAGCLGGGAAWAGSYTFHPVAFPGAKTTDLNGLNDSDELVGTFTDQAGAKHGFSLIDGRYAQIDAKGGKDTYLWSVNRGGVAVGDVTTVDGSSLLFTHDLRTGAESFTKPPSAGLEFGYATINAAGVIAGSLFTRDFQPLTYLKNSDGLRIIRRPPGPPDGYYVSAMNDRAVVVGNSYRADGTSGSFIFKAGVSTLLDIPGYRDTSLVFVTDGGVFGGAVVDAKLNQHGFTDSGGKVSFVAYPGADADNVAGVTASGAVIGQWFTGVTSKGYVLSGGVFHNLDVPSAPDWSVYVSSVNAFGSLIGTALSPSGGRLISFVAVCRHDQVPCTR